MMMGCGLRAETDGWMMGLRVRRWADRGFFEPWVVESFVGEEKGGGQQQFFSSQKDTKREGE
jgi:hypothetical protein